MKQEEIYNAYDRFELLESICEMVQKPSRYNNSRPELKNTGSEYHKIVFTGTCELTDYSRGYLSLSIFPYADMFVFKTETTDFWQVRFSIINIDDVMISGWSNHMSIDKVNETVEKIAKEFENVATLGTLEDINSILQPYGIYAVIE